MFRQTVAGNVLVGTYAVLSNQGGLIAPRTAASELDELSSLLQIPLIVRFEQFCMIAAYCTMYILSTVYTGTLYSTSTYKFIFRNRFLET